MALDIDKKDLYQGTENVHVAEIVGVSLLFAHVLDKSAEMFRYGRVTDEEIRRDIKGIEHVVFYEDILVGILILEEVGA